MGGQDVCNSGRQVFMTALSNRFCTFVSQMQSAKNTRVDPRVDSISEIGRAQICKKILFEKQICKKNYLEIDQITVHKTKKLT